MCTAGKSSCRTDEIPKARHVSKSIVKLDPRSSMKDDFTILCYEKAGSQSVCFTFRMSKLFTTRLGKSKS